MVLEPSPRPWTALPVEVAAVLRPELQGLADEIIATISRGVPDYARPLEGPFGRGLRMGVEEALHRFVALVEDPGAEGGPARDVYVELGRTEMRAGRSLNALLAAYRLGARVAWRRLAAAGEAAGLEPRTLYLVAESIFAYIDELSAESIEGYTLEREAVLGERQRRRLHIASLLVQEPPAESAAVEAAAAEAGWPLPRTLAAVAVESDDADRLAPLLGPDVIAAPRPPFACALVPDALAPGRRAQLEAALSGMRAALGPSVPWPDAGLSAARACATLELALDGALEQDGLLAATDHSLALLLSADRRLTQELSSAALPPLEELTPAARERLRATLEAWLRHRGRTEEVARALHVHPQTVRYRLARLRELFGDRLDAPDGRFELDLALRGEGAASAG
jgi:PucR-like helix-turn-helix protein